MVIFSMVSWDTCVYLFPRYFWHFVINYETENYIVKLNRFEVEKNPIN